MAAQADAAAVTAINAAGTIATSNSSLAIGNGTKTLALTQTGKQFGIGQFVMIARTAAPNTYLHGQITAYDSSTGAMTVTIAEFCVA